MTTTKPLFLHERLLAYRFSRELLVAQGREQLERATRLTLGLLR